MESEYSLKEYGRWLCEGHDKNERDVSNEPRVLTGGGRWKISTRVGPRRSKIVATSDGSDV